MSYWVQVLYSDLCILYCISSILQYLKDLYGCLLWKPCCPVHVVNGVLIEMSVLFFSRILGFSVGLLQKNRNLN